MFTKLFCEPADYLVTVYPNFVWNKIDLKKSNFIMICKCLFYNYNFHIPLESTLLPSNRSIRFARAM